MASAVKALRMAGLKKIKCPDDRYLKVDETTLRAMEKQADAERSQAARGVDEVIVQALVRLQNCAAARGQVFNIGSTEEITILDLAKLVIATLGAKSGIELVPYAQANGAGRFAAAALLGVVGVFSTLGRLAFGPLALDVLRIEDGSIREITTFEPHLFTAFGLPETLD